jgi:hypothetical protein
VALEDFDARIGRGNHFFAIGAVPDGDAMSPPELARDAPVANAFEPIQKNRPLVIGNDFKQAACDRLLRRFGQRLHLAEPLRGKARLDDSLAAIAGADGMCVLRYLLD